MENGKRKKPATQTTGVLGYNQSNQRFHEP